MGCTSQHHSATWLMHAWQLLAQRRVQTLNSQQALADFLDPMHHEAATGRPACNLDGWMLNKQQVRHTHQTPSLTRCTRCPQQALLGTRLMPQQQVIPSTADSSSKGCGC